VLVGRENPTEDDTLNVLAVQRYGAGWNLLGTAYVEGDATQDGVEGIYSPFDAGAPHMLLVGDRLVVHMSRLIYAIAGIHHQVNLTFEVDVSTMQATTFYELGEVSYTSHSFQQLLATYGQDLVMVDQGDAFPREIQMGVMAGYPEQRNVTDYDVFDFNGSEGDNFTGTTLTGIASGPSGIVLVGTSIPQPDAPSGTLGSPDEQSNAYVIAANPDTGAHATTWLTNFPSSGEDDAFEPRVVQVGLDRYAALFATQHQNGDGTVSDTVQYRLIDSAGAALARASFPSVLFCATADPILVGDTVYWPGVDPNGPDGGSNEYWSVSTSQTRPRPRSYGGTFGAPG
jgi:hypothetical protein